MQGNATSNCRRRRPAARPGAGPSPGTRLVREWNGRTHVVDVSEDGFVFDGKTYRSLSAIAKRITGATLVRTKVLRAMSSCPRLRCAVYTRKSTEEGLDQEFNSLDAQREACAAFIASQVGLGWKLVPDRYDDGGISGGTMERPALQRLLQDIRDKKVDVVVVYKIDRLTRSLIDFSRIVEVFDQARRVVRLGHPAVQHHDLDGQADAQRASVLCPVRAGGHGRAHPRQDRRLEEEGHVDGRRGAARLPGREPEAGRQSGGSQNRPLAVRTLSRAEVGPCAGR